METQSDDDIEWIAGLRLEDILKFRQVYTKAQVAPLEERGTFKELFANLGHHTTTVGQLERIVDFLFGPSPQRGPRFELLFERSSDNNGLVPTDESHELYKRSKILVDACRSMRDVFRPSQRLPTVKIGAAGTIGFWLLSSIYSNWNRQFGGRMRLEVELGASRDLISRLNAGLLDFVVAYGSEDRKCVREAGLDVRFDSLGYKTRMVLIAHPTEDIKLKNGTDINEGYWQASYENKTTPKKASRKKPDDLEATDQRRPDYDDLRALDLADLNFSTTRLIVVPSWRQPDALQRFTDDLRRHVEVRQVPYYDEALALVRMALGVAPVPEVFLRRRRITAFQLLPPENFTRWIGVFYNTTRGLTPQACSLVSFLQYYMTGPGFKDAISRGRPIGYGHPAFHEHCASFDFHQNWERIAAKEFPKS